LGERFDLAVEAVEEFVEFFEMGFDVDINGFAVADGGARFWHVGGVIVDCRLQVGELEGVDIVIGKRGEMRVGAVVDELAERREFFVADACQA